MKKLTAAAALFILAALVLGACNAGKFEGDFSWDVKPFEYTNQHGEAVSLEDLEGQPWLAQFVFTNCTSVCPPMMFNMAEVQDHLAEAGVEDYKIVSFSVDPEFDTPEKLQEYLDTFEVSDQSKWEMLTGYTMDDIADLAVKSFKVPVIAPPQDSDQVTHASSFFLVNQEGKAVKSYDGYMEVPHDIIVEDMKALIKAGS